MAGRSVSIHLQLRSGVLLPHGSPLALLALAAGSPRVNSMLVAKPRKNIVVQ